MEIQGAINYHVQSGQNDPYVVPMGFLKKIILSITLFLSGYYIEYNSYTLVVTMAINYLFVLKRAFSYHALFWKGSKSFTTAVGSKTVLIILSF